MAVSEDNGAGEANELSTPETFGLHNWVDAYRPPVPDTFVCRRAVAARLADISQRLVRADISDVELTQLDAQLAALQAQLQHIPRHHHAAQYGDMLAGRADKTRVMMAFDYDAVTGPSNPAAPRLVFDLDPGPVSDTTAKPTSDNLATAIPVTARVTLGALHEGGPGNAHGGIIAAMLDVVLARVQHRHGWIGVTGYLNVRYLAPTPLYQPLILKAWPASRIGRVTKVEGGVWLGDVQTVAADAMFVVPRGR